MPQLPEKYRDEVDLLGWINGAYKIRNKVNGKVYIGGAYGRDGFKARWKRHRIDLRYGRHNNKHLQEAWKKYGETAFVFEVLERCPSIKEIIIACEQKWLDCSGVGDHSKCYNINPTANSNLGVKYPEETNEKKRIAMRKIYKNNPEARARQSANTKKVSGTPEARVKAGVITKRNWENSEYRTKILSSRKKTVESLEYRAKQSTTMKKICGTPEAKVKKSATTKKYWEDTVYRTKQTNNSTKQWKDPKIRAKRISGMKEYAAKQLVIKAAALELQYSTHYETEVVSIGKRVTLITRNQGE